MSKLYFNNSSKLHNNNEIGVKEKLNSTSIEFIPEDLFIEVSMDKDFNKDRLIKFIKSLSPKQIKELKDSINNWRNSLISSSDELAVKDGSIKVNRILKLI